MYIVKRGKLQVVGDDGQKVKLPIFTHVLGTNWGMKSQGMSFTTTDD